MKLYERYDGMPWREVHETPYAIVGALENEPDGLNAFEDTANLCACVLIPAPDAEAKVAAWETFNGAVADAIGPIDWFALADEAHRMGFTELADLAILYGRMLADTSEAIE